MSQLSQVLKKLQLSEERGVIFLAKIDGWLQLERAIFSFEIRERLHKINPDAVYHFNNQPFILFFDKSDSNGSYLKEDAQIFKETWSWDFVPVVFIIYPDGDKVFNAFNYQKQVGKSDTLQELTFRKGENKYELFSFWQLQSGRTWEWLENNFYKKGTRNVLNQQRVNHRLFANIKYAREQLEEFFPYPEFINLLILRLIFIRYLIDREVEIDEKFLNGNSIEENRTCFNRLISDGKGLLEFFGYLKDRFNGNLFDTTGDPDIPQKALGFIQQFFSAEFSDNTSQPSLFYFDVYDFSIIPVEVISGIYESVIDDEKRKEESAVYTPLFLADYILKNTIDKHLEDESNQLCKVLDPSCGSGIFLTQTYRRLVERERQLGNLNDRRLVEIAEQNIFGIDRDVNALNVAAFSIYISILDYKKPKEIKTFHLPKLIGENLFRNDFFNEDDTITEIDGVVAHSYNSKLKKEELNFIIGNPPWGNKSDEKVDKFHLSYAKKMGNLLANYEISQSFLIRVKDFSTNQSNCSLIVSNRAFYSPRADKFRTYFFNNFITEGILDLSAARRMVFQDADSPCIVISYRFAFFKQTADNTIEHVSVKPNIFLKNHKIIVIESEDLKHFPQKYFIENDWFFKAALFGSKLDFHLLNRLSKIKRSLKSELEKNEIYSNAGVKKGNPPQKAEFLIDAYLIENSQVMPYYTHINKDHIKLSASEVFFKDIRSEEIFKGEQILFKAQAANETELAISFIDKDEKQRNIAFYHDIFSLSTQNNLPFLHQLFGCMISRLYSYFTFMIATAWGTSTRPAIRINEFLRFPYVEINIENLTKYVEEFINEIKSYSILGKTVLPSINTLSSYKKIDQAINLTYEISPMEEDLIDYTLNVSRYQFQESKLQKFLRKPRREELKQYADIFFDYFSTVYNENGEHFQIEIFNLSHFTAMKFNIVRSPVEVDHQVVFSDNLDEMRLFEILSSDLSIYELTSDIFIQKNVRGYEEDFFYILKPNEYKCWHKAIAHQDLALFKSEMMQAELDLMTESHA